MKYLPATRNITFYLVLIAIAVITNSSNCGGDDPKINYEYGFFPDTVLSLDGLNTSYDDYNMALPQLLLEMPVVFSSNRESSGDNFNFVTGAIHYVFNQIDGSFVLQSEMYSNQFFSYLQGLTNTDGNELGPMRLFNSLDGREYFFYATDDGSDNLDIKFLDFFPSGGISPPIDASVKTASVLNSTSDDAYLTVDWDFDYVYLTSDRGGDFDIYQIEVDKQQSFISWLLSPAETMTKTDSINSASNDKCPYIMDNLMVFTSDRPGGMGGYDLYYSEFVNGKWSSPTNMGPGINTEYNEYRPVVGFAGGFTNDFMIFSSDRPGGKGGYDLYFAGLDL